MDSTIVGFMDEDGTVMSISDGVSYYELNLALMSEPCSILSDVICVNDCQFTTGESTVTTIFVKNNGDIGWADNFDLRLTDANSEANTENIAYQQNHPLLVNNTYRQWFHCCRISHG